MPKVPRDKWLGNRQPDRHTLLAQAKAGAAVLWCTNCDRFWREYAHPTLGWVKSVGRKLATSPPGEDGCPACGEIYVIWENYPEWQKLAREG